MKKTLTITIRRVVFHIEEDAYDALSTYLSKINGKFSRNVNGDRIIADIESRIAELFRQRLTNDFMVITLPLVNEVVSIMGVPEDVITDSQGNSDAPSKTVYASGSKKLYRDPDSRVIGGVCSGLAYYMNLDKVLVRVIFFLLIFLTSGAMIPIYLLLWIAVPKAKTTAQRIEMHGQPVNVESIGKSVRNDTSGNETNGQGSDAQAASIYVPKNGNNSTGNFISSFFGILLLVVGILSLLAIFVGFIAAIKLIGTFPFLNGGVTPLFFTNHLFSGETSLALMVSAFLIAAIPIMVIIFFGTKLLFRYEANTGSIILSALGIWFLAILVAVFVSISAIDVFSTETSVTDNMPIVITNTDTLYVSLNQDNELEASNTIVRVNNFKVVEVNGKEKLIGKPSFTIRPASEGMGIEVERTAKGSNHRHAKSNSSAIQLNHSLSGNKLVIDPYFTIDDSERWRNQNVYITLRIPTNRVLYIDESILPIMNNIRNQNNFSDEEMVNRYWRMTNDGLMLSE